MGYLDKDGLSRAFTKLKTLIDGKAGVGHTHNYAGSSSAGGAATSANKLNTNAGSGTQPVYFANGIPVACTSYGNASVKYATSSGSANSATYATSAGSAGSVAWSNVSGKPTSMPASDVYSWAKASSKPSYSASEVGAVPTSRTVNGKALSANITLSAGDVGAAASSHSHNYAGSNSAGGNAIWASGATYSQYTFCDKQTVTSGSGSAYTATVIRLSLVAGNSFVMVPHTTSTTTAPTLNVNGLGAKNIRMRLSSNTSSTIQLIRSDFLVANKPVRVVYDGTYWVLDDFVQPDASCLYGTLISRGTSAPSNSTGGFIYIQTT